jgi:hypothetical protein
MYKRTLFTHIAVSVALSGCTIADKNTPNSIKTSTLEPSSNATEICNAEARAYQPTQAVVDGAAGEILRSAVKDSLLIVGGGFGGEIVRAQQIKKNQDAREKILAECLKNFEKSK